MQVEDPGAIVRTLRGASCSPEAIEFWRCGRKGGAQKWMKRERFQLLDDLDYMIHGLGKR